jgi:hypothetical protein
MKRSADLIWLACVLAAVALAVAITPFEIPLPRVKPVARASPVATPDVFTLMCTGSRHARAYTGYPGPLQPQYFADVGLVDHP